MKKDNIKKLIKKLVSYQLESPYSLNQEVILDELDNFYKESSGLSRKAEDQKSI